MGFTKGNSGNTNSVAGQRLRDTTKPLRMVVDFTATDKTQMLRLERDVTRMLERITGVSVHSVLVTRPELVKVHQEATRGS